MRKILISLILLCTSFAFATPVVLGNPVFQQDVADSLIVRMKEYIDNNESYYLVNSKQQELDEYLLLNLSSFATDIRTNEDLATKSISYSMTKKTRYIPKNSFLFSREIEQSEVFAKAIFSDNKSSKIEHQVYFSRQNKPSVQDGEIALWRSALVSLIAGTLIYSLWSIE